MSAGSTPSSYRTGATESVIDSLAFGSQDWCMRPIAIVTIRAASISFLCAATLVLGAGRAVAVDIAITPKPPVGPGVGSLIMPSGGSATVVVSPSGAMTVTSGSAVFFTPGGGIGATGTAFPTPPQVTIICTSPGQSKKCARNVFNVTIQAAGGGTGPSGTPFNFTVGPVSCANCSFGTPSGSSILSLPINGSADFTAVFNVGMSVTFSPGGVTGPASVPFSVSVQ